MTDTTNPNREQAREAVLRDLRGRKLLKYLFDSEPENCAAYGYVDTPIDLETQAEIADTLVSVVVAALTPEAERVEIPARRPLPATRSGWPVGMKPWDDDGSAPFDWDRGAVLCDDGAMYDPPIEWSRPSGGPDVIAYTLKPTEAAFSWGDGFFVSGDARSCLEVSRLSEIAPAQDSRDVAGAEAAWRDGWAQCKASLTDDEAFCLTEDVEQDAWLDSDTRRALPLPSTPSTPVSSGPAALNETGGSLKVWDAALDPHTTEGEA